jgi:hypothetical protein
MRCTILVKSNHGKIRFKSRILAKIAGKEAFLLACLLFEIAAPPAAVIATTGQHLVLH